jgi:cytochrome c553
MTPAMAQLGAADLGGLAAYYGAQPPGRATSGDATLAEAGRKLFSDGDLAAGIPPCASCHQPGGAGHARYPRLAGQPAAYTRQQLASFKAGTRRNDRGHVMRDVAARLSEPQMQALAAYLAGL